MALQGFRRRGTIFRATCLTGAILSGRCRPGGPDGVHPEHNGVKFHSGSYPVRGPFIHGRNLFAGGIHQVRRHCGQPFFPVRSPDRWEDFWRGPLSVLCSAPTRERRTCLTSIPTGNLPAHGVVLSYIPLVRPDAFLTKPFS